MQPQKPPPESQFLKKARWRRRPPVPQIMAAFAAVTITLEFTSDKYFNLVYRWKTYKVDLIALPKFIFTAHNVNV